jgi:hypothetical protein
MTANSYSNDRVFSRMTSNLRIKIRNMPPTSGYYGRTPAHKRGTARVWVKFRPAQRPTPVQAAQQWLSYIVDQTPVQV